MRFLRPLCSFCKTRALHLRGLTDNGSKSAAPIPQHLITDFDFQITEDQFKALSERYLSSLADHLDSLASRGAIDNDEFDVEHSGDVLTVNTGVKDMKYVINRQTPNRQMWLSSPLSGPFRYDYTSDNRSWTYRRTGEKMITLLDREFTSLYTQDCAFEQFETDFFATFKL